MNEDLSTLHRPITSLFAELSPATRERFSLSPEQIEFFHANGYLAGISLLTEAQVEALRADLAKLVEPSQESSPLFYEYHSNESTDPAKILFHCITESSG